MIRSHEPRSWTEQPGQGLDEPEIQRPKAGQAVVLIRLSKGVGDDQAVSMLQGILYEAIPGIDVNVLFAMFMDGNILASARNYSKGCLGSEQPLHVLLKL